MEPIILIQSPYFPIRYWENLYNLLKKKSYKVSLVEYPESEVLTRPLLGGLQFELQVLIKKKIEDKGQVHIVAHGWACMLVAYLTKDLKKSIKSVTFISPMGVHSYVSRWESAISWPVIGKYIFRIFSSRIWKDDFSGLAKNSFKKFSHNRLMTILKANKILHQEGLQVYYEELVMSDLPLLILLGVQTKRYKQPIHPTFKYWRKEILMVPIHKGEHFLSNEQPFEVLSALEKFWRVTEGQLSIKSK